MKKIYSKKDDVLIAIVTKFQDFNRPRIDVTPAEEFLQAALMRCNNGTRFRPHKHIWKDFNSQYGYNQIKTQECWIVFRGLIKVTIYDDDDSILNIIILQEGDAVFLFHGGHTFECMEDHSCIFEFKTGPYEGQAKDKVFIDEKS